MNNRSFIISALLGGVAIGILGNLPILNLINCFFCLFAWLGGVLAVFIYKPVPGGPALTNGQGAGLGALAGLIGAVIGLPIYLLTSSLSNPIFNDLIRTLGVEGNFQFETNFGAILVTGLVFFFIDAILYAGFAALAAFITNTLRNRTPSVT